MARGGRPSRRARGRKAKRLAPVPPRRPRLGISPAAALASVLGIGVLIGIALAYHLVQPELDAARRVAATQSAPPPAEAAPVKRPEPVPPTVEIAKTTQPPEALARSPFGLPRAAERPEPPAAPGPNAAVAPPSLPRALDASPPRPIEPVVLQAPDLQPPAAAHPTWRRYAVPASAPPGRPLIAILIDDVGVHRRNALRIVELPGPLTLAYMTYAENLPKLTAAARARGHELMLHLPMEPLDYGVDAGPNALEAHLDPGELRRRLIWGLDRFEGYVGVNNHMGSRFTAWEPGMEMVMEELRRRGLLFVDSRTVSGSLGARMAERYDVPHADRDVFLDNEHDGAAVAVRLAELEEVARMRGMAVGIGHPHDGTIAALAEWLPTLREKGFALVPVTAIVERRAEQRARSAAAVPPS